VGRPNSKSEITVHHQALLGAPDLNHVREEIKRPPLWNVKRFQIDGPLLERWFLKTLINVSSGEKWPIGPGSHRKGTPSKELVEIAFGSLRFKDGGGLYITSRAGEQIDSMDRVNVQPLTERENVVAGPFQFPRGYRFFLNLLPQEFKMDGNSQLLHQQGRCLKRDHRANGGAVTMNCRTYPTTHKIGSLDYPEEPYFDMTFVEGLDGRFVVSTFEYTPPHRKSTLTVQTVHSLAKTEYAKRKAVPPIPNSPSASAKPNCRQSWCCRCTSP
jgi:hypothetical protein